MTTATLVSTESSSFSLEDWLQNPPEHTEWINGELVVFWLLSHFPKPTVEQCTQKSFAQHNRNHGNLDVGILK